MPDLPVLVREPTGTATCIEGRVGFVPVAVGAKQQHVGPVVVDADGRAVRLYVLGDTPFSHALARRYDGRRVSVAGTWRNGAVEAEETDIVDLDAPPASEE